MRRVADYVTGEPFEVWCCRRCGFGVTRPRPADLDRYYPPAYRKYGGAAGFALRWLYERRARRWARALPSRGTALEIGCGEGWMLRALRRRGWRVVGVERASAPDPGGAVDRIPMFVGDLRAIRAAPRFDLVVLFQTLEHLDDPSGVLRTCAAVVRPGGRIVVAVPNFASWQAMLFGGAWFHLDPPRHLSHFSRESLRRFLEAAGFRVERVSYMSWEHDPYGWVQSALNALGFPPNLLTRGLMDRDRRLLGGGRGALMLGVTVALLPAAVVCALASWVGGAGAIIEVQAVRA